jgi:hypothetical protein
MQDFNRAVAPTPYLTPDSKDELLIHNRNTLMVPPSYQTTFANRPMQIDISIGNFTAFRENPRTGRSIPVYVRTQPKKKLNLCGCR